MRTPKLVELQDFTGWGGCSALIINCFKLCQRDCFRTVFPVERDNQLVIEQENRVDEDVHDGLAILRVVEVAILKPADPPNDLLPRDRVFLDFFTGEGDFKVGFLGFQFVKPLFDGSVSNAFFYGVYQIVYAFVNIGELFL